MQGLEPGGVAVLPADSPTAVRVLRAAARRRPRDDVRRGAEAPTSRLLVGDERCRRHATARGVVGTTLALRLDAPGRHMAMNALAALAAVAALGARSEQAARVRWQASRRCAAAARAGTIAVPRRQRAAARRELQRQSAPRCARRWRCCGCSRRRGASRCWATCWNWATQGRREHAALADAVAGVGRLLFACGPLMRALFDAVPAAHARRACRRFRGAGAAGRAPRCAPGDAVLVKGSLGSRMKPSSRRSTRSTPVGGSGLMLYNLARPLADQFILFNLFRYITFRSGAACLTALVVSFVLGPTRDPLAALGAAQRPADPRRTGRSGI